MDLTNQVLIRALDLVPFDLLAQASGVGSSPTLDLGKGARWLGVEWIGINAENGRKLLITVVFVVVVSLVAWALSWLTSKAIGGYERRRVAFWVRQTLHLLSAAVLLLGVLSIWFDDPTRLATAFGLVAAGLAFALQRVVTSVAGYFVILKGPIFDIGDRIAMGGVRGDVIALGFTQTTIMEMGQPPGVKTEPPEVWVRSRQYTGRIVSVPNAKIFDEAIYNYSREFPYIWEEITLPISYSADRDRAEQILKEAIERHCPPMDLSPGDLKELKRRYPVDVANMKSEIYYRLTDNWLELTARFVTHEFGVRKLKDAISRDLIRELDAAGIGIASATFEIVGLPKLDVKVESSERP